MTKRALALMLCAVFVILCGCGKAKDTDKDNSDVSDTSSVSKKEAPSMVLENRLTEMPVYALSEGATADEMRAMAVKAMRDQLTVPFYLTTSISYRKSGAASKSVFCYNKNKNYAGLPYSSGNTGLLHFLQYYDFDTGCLVGVTEADMRNNLGNSCATGVIWGWNSVCTSTTCSLCADMAPRNGALPVGDYKTETISLNKGTDSICKANGEQTMYKAYAQILPADALIYIISSGDHANHVIMAVEAAAVKYNDDGTINGDMSYIYYQDQYVGMLKKQDPFYVNENGTYVQYAGNRYTKINFSTLWKSCYIPITTAEFKGEAPYKKATVAIKNGKIANYSQLQSDTVTSNYGIITLTATVKEGDKEVATEKLITKTGDMKKGRVGSIKLERLLKNKNLTSKLKSGKTYSVKIDALVATGETLTVFEGSVKK